MNRRQLFFGAVAATLAPAVPAQARDLNRPLPEYWWEFEFAQGEQFYTYGYAHVAAKRAKQFGMGCNLTRISQYERGGKLLRTWRWNAHAELFV